MNRTHHYYGGSFAIVLNMTLNRLFLLLVNLSRKGMVMLEEFEKWLAGQCPWYYLLSQEQEDWYFSQWIDEVCSKRKESAEHEEMV